MKFIIFRTSDSSMEKTPCEQAVLDEMLTAQHINEWDYESGSRLWAMEILTLGDLLDLQEAVGERLVLHTVFYNYLVDELALPAIEIYDGWRE